MNIFIAGGGRVGFHLARLLSVENHDVTVIESDSTQLELVDMALDVQTVLGNVTSIMLLKESGAGSADLFVSMTGNDETNLIAAATAKALGAKVTVARVDDPIYVESNILYESCLGIDYLLSPEALTAMEIARYIQAPGIVAAETFAEGRVQMRQVRVTKSPTVNGKTLGHVCPPGSGVLLGVISRKGEVIIPPGDTVVEPGDLVTLIGQSDKLKDVQKLFRAVEQRLDKVAIMGGGAIGLHLAQVLEDSQRSVKLYDRDAAHCQTLAAKLRKTDIVCRDATDRGALEQEHLEECDVFVSTTRDDEHNIMAAVLAKEVGSDLAIAVIHQPDFAPLVGKLGIDHAVTPRACVANRILKLVHQKSASTTAVLEEGQVEILEFVITSEVPVIGSSLKDIRSKFPRRALVATIIRGDSVIVPSGDDELHAEDSVIVVATPGTLEPLQKLFQR